MQQQGQQGGPYENGSSSPSPSSSSMVLPHHEDYYDDESHGATMVNLENASSLWDAEMMMMSSHIKVTEVLPPPNHSDIHVLIMSLAYLLLFVLGIAGNTAVLVTIRHVVRSRRQRLDNTLLYIVVLCLVDFGVCLSLPFTVIDQILGFWMFGTVLCKVYAMLESFGKILSALILAAMSFDRYAGVCHPQSHRLRSRRLAIGVLVGLAAYALVTLCPLLLSFSARDVVMFERRTAPDKVTRMKVSKCTLSPTIGSREFTMFVVYEFVLSYLLPLGLVVFFYTSILSTLRQHAKQFRSSHIPLRRVSLYTLFVVAFYFLCWSPFWAATVYAIYLEVYSKNDQLPAFFVYIMYFIHALPFTNSAVNWILYGALNGQLQQRRAQCNSKSGAVGDTALGDTLPPLPLVHNNNSSSLFARPRISLRKEIDQAETQRLFSRTHQKSVANGHGPPKTAANGGGGGSRSVRGSLVLLGATVPNGDLSPMTVAEQPAVFL